MITVKTPSRVHLGILDLSGKSGRLYGGVGVGLKRPNVVLTAKESKRFKVTGEQKELVRPMAKKILDHFNVSRKVSIDIKETIPQHVGLGSGTQLALALGTALSGLFELDITTEEIALMFGRGRISGVGIGVFKEGGFVVDGGHKQIVPSVPPITFHRRFPKDWVFVVAIPKSRKGFFGKDEVSAFQKVVPGSSATAEKICWLLQMEMLPSLVEEDIYSFGKSIIAIDRLVGSYFKKAQSGIYREKVSGELIRTMMDNGASGAGQSSWGPAVYGLTKRGNANELENTVREFLDDRRSKGEVFIASPDNKGARID